MGGTNFSDAVPGALITHYLTNSSGNWILARCSSANLPTGAGYAVGCMIQLSDTGALVENTGTTTGAFWTPVSTAGASEVFVSNGNGTTLVRLAGSPTSTVNGIVKAFEVISLDTNGGGNITFSNGSAAQNIVVKAGSLGAVTGSSGANMPFTTSGCLSMVSNTAAAFVGKAYFSTPTF